MDVLAPPSLGRPRSTGPLRRSEIDTTGGKLGTGIKRVQTLHVVLMLAILGFFFGAQPAMATETNPVPSATEQPSEPGTPTRPVTPPVVVPPVLEPTPQPTPVAPENTPEPPPPAEEPAPAVPPAPETPAVVPVAPTAPPQATLAPVPPADTGVQGYVVEPEVPEETSTQATVEPTPTPTPVATKTATPVVAGGDITGPLKTALAPVAENNPLVQGATVLILVLLGVAYFKALRTKGVPRARLNGK